MRLITIALAATLTSCASGAGGASVSAACVSNALAPISLEGREKLLPSFIRANEISLEQIEEIVRALPAQQKAKLALVVKGVLPSRITSAQGFREAHDDIYAAFVARGARVYRAEQCGSNEAVGAQIFVVVSDWLLSAYGEPDARLRRFGNSRRGYDLASVVRTAVILNISGISYNFTEFKSALSTKVEEGH